MVPDVEFTQTLIWAGLISTQAKTLFRGRREREEDVRDVWELSMLSWKISIERISGVGGSVE